VLSRLRQVTLGGQQDAEVAQRGVGEADVADLARSREREIELRTCFGVAALLLIEEP